MKPSEISTKFRFCLAVARFAAYLRLGILHFCFGWNLVLSEWPLVQDIIFLMDDITNDFL
jgi:hypothetical protein